MKINPFFYGSSFRLPTDKMYFSGRGRWRNYKRGKERIFLIFMAFSCYVESFMDFYIHCSCHRNRSLLLEHKKVSNQFYPLLWSSERITCMGLINGTERKRTNFSTFIVKAWKTFSLFRCAVITDIIWDVCQLCGALSQLSSAKRKGKGEQFRDDLNVLEIAVRLTLKRLVNYTNESHMSCLFSPFKVASQSTTDAMRCGSTSPLLPMFLVHQRTVFVTGVNETRTKQHNRRTLLKENENELKLFSTFSFLVVPFDKKTSEQQATGRAAGRSKATNAIFQRQMTLWVKCD